MDVRAKKHLGQHFLRDEDAALRIVEGIDSLNPEHVIEIGPGDGVLSKYLFERYKNLELFDVDVESIQFLKDKYPIHRDKIKLQDFLQSTIDKDCVIIGNFPYNISSQIVFKILDNKERVEGMVGMFQKEVGERIVSPPGNRDYGILSVFTQAYYDVEYLFTVDENAFDPPPKVKSGVIRLIRKESLELGCDEKKFRSIVKRAFNQRRKMLRKSLRDLINESNEASIEKYLTLRPERLSWEDFVILTNCLMP